MKKRFLLTVLSCVCALCCALGLAACGGNGDNGGNVVTVTLQQTPEAVNSVQLICYATGNRYDLGKATDSWSINLAKDGNEYTVNVVMEVIYTIGDIKTYINGKEVRLMRDESKSGDDEAFVYSCGFTPTEDTTIMLSGEGELRSTSVDFHYSVNWSPCYDVYEGQADAAAKAEALKTAIKNDVYVKLLVNDEEIAPFDGITIDAYASAVATTHFVTVNMTDKVEFIVYTESEELELSKRVISLNGTLIGGATQTLSDDKKSFSVRIEEIRGIVQLEVRPYIVMKN